MTDEKQVTKYFKTLQTKLCQQFEQLDGQGKFQRDFWDRHDGGGGLTRIMTDGRLIEKGGVNYSAVHGNELPASATANRPHLVGRRFSAQGVSIVIHPDNPYVPTTHANLRFFLAEKAGEAPVWWFGGGYDLTPYYPFEEDAILWHQHAKEACDPFGPDYYTRFKRWCDQYFFIKHRQEARGIGGLFFDDFNEGSFKHAFGFVKAIGHSFFPAFEAIAKKRRHMRFGQREKQFQLYRRGRYVEFNLVYDRGTLFGLQSGGRTESILMSLPPQVRWEYAFQPEPGSPEEKLTKDFLKPRDWLD